MEALINELQSVLDRFKSSISNNPHQNTTGQQDSPESINWEHGKWYRVQAKNDWLIKFDKVENENVIVLQSFCITTSGKYGAGPNCHINSIQSCSPATPEDMQLLPDGHPEKPKPALAATYDEIVDVVKPKWMCEVRGNINRWDSIDFYQLPTEAAAKQDRAFIQIKNLEAYCAVKFEGDRAYTIEIPVASILIHVVKANAPFKFTKEAAEWLIANHPEPFLMFFGVKS